MGSRSRARAFGGSEAMDPQPALIPNRSLTAGKVPDLIVESLDLREPCAGPGPSEQEWGRLWTFALTYDGYTYFGGDPGAAQRLGAFAESVKEAFVSTR